MLLTKRVHRPTATLSQIFDTFLNEDILNYPTKVNQRRKFVPSVNIKETEDGFNLELAVPGLAKEDIQIELNENVLIISSEKKEAKDESCGKDLG